MNDGRFKVRSCPFCNSDRKTELFALSAAQIFAANWSYQTRRLSSLSLPEELTFPIARCLECSFVFASLLPDSEFLGTVYDEVIDDKTARSHSAGIESMTTRMRYLSRLLLLLQSNSVASAVLDFGCGFGPTLELLNAVGSVCACGFDTSALRINELRGKGLQVSREIDEIRRFAPFAAVVLDNVLEHMPDPRGALRLVRSLCVDGAIVFVSVPNADISNLKRQALTLERGGLPSMEINPWEHLNYFDMTHLDRMMQSEGFAVLKQSEVPGEVEIGLRPGRRFTARFKNAAASSVRLFRYVFGGDPKSTVNARFYRCSSINP